LEVGFAEIDKQHRRLVRIANSLYEARFSAKGAEVIRSMVTEFLNYANEHFNYELRLLQRQGSSQIDQHRSTHQKLLAELADKCRSISDNRTNVATSGITSLHDWLVNEILGADKASFEEIHECWRMAA
jgi:hemerythrin-like metal-binding protein